MSIPIKEQYSPEELKQYFGNFIVDYQGEREVISLENLIELIQPGNDHIALIVMYQLFGNPYDKKFPEEQKRYQANKSKINRFAQLNYLDTKTFGVWYRNGQNPKPEYTLAVRRFLLTGFLYINVPTVDVINYRHTNLSKYQRFPNVLLIDGDNLYYHITPLFRMIRDNYYTLIFYKKDNISNNFSSFYRSDSKNIDVIEALGFKKDAADVDLTTLCTYIRIDYLQRHSERMVLPEKRFYVVTGDEYADELVNISNLDLSATSDNKLFDRLNAQPILYEFNQHSWSFDAAEIYPKSFGEILPAEYRNRLKINTSIVDAVFNKNQKNIFQFNPMCTPWLIKLLKRSRDNQNIMKPQYSTIVNILSNDRVINFESFLKVVNSMNIPLQDKIELHEQYFVLIGAKYFTRRELRDSFLVNHVNYLISILLKKSPNEEGFYQLTPEETKKLLEQPVSFPGELYIFYNVTQLIDLFTQTLDIPAALGVERINFGQNGNIVSLVVRVI